jgi:hypothetical protein
MIVAIMIEFNNSKNIYHDIGFRSCLRILSLPVHLSNFFMPEISLLLTETDERANLSTGEVAQSFL